MTDFIHEHPKAPQAEKKPAYVPPKTEKERQKKVYTYISVLFCVAMLLLLWSSMMTNRSNQETLSALRQDVSTMQSVMDRSVALEKENEALKKENVVLKAEKEALERKAAALESEIRSYHENEAAPLP